MSVDPVLLIYLSSFLALVLLLLFVLRSKIFNRYVLVTEAPLIRYGIEAECEGYFVKADQPGAVRREWFHHRTLLLGYDRNNARGAALARFLFTLPYPVNPRSRDTTLALTFETERAHGGLHSSLGPKQKRAFVYANGTLVDEIWLIQKMPNGEDYGYRNVGPIPVEPDLMRGTFLEVLLRIEAEVSWDIDRALVSLSTRRRSLTPAGSMCAGAILSVIVGLVPLILEKLLLR